MNDNELRDRIAETLYNHDMRTDYPGEPWVPDFHSGDNRTRPDYQARAQAIIDELGLRYEYRPRFAEWDQPQKRITGNWETQ